MTELPFLRSGSTFCTANSAVTKGGDGLLDDYVCRFLKCFPGIGHRSSHNVAGRRCFARGTPAIPRGCLTLSANGMQTLGISERQHAFKDLVDRGAAIRLRATSCKA
jgi:hypothetical protein